MPRRRLTFTSLNIIVFAIIIFFSPTRLKAQQCGDYELVQRTAEIAGYVVDTWFEFQWVSRECAGSPWGGEPAGGDLGGGGGGGGDDWGGGDGDGDGDGDDSDDGNPDEDDNFTLVGWETLRNPTPPNEIWDTKNINVEVAVLGSALVGPATVFIAGELAVEISLAEFYAWSAGLTWSLSSRINFYYAVLNWCYTAQNRYIYRNYSTGEVRTTWGSTENIMKPVKGVFKAELGARKYHLTAIDNTGILRWW